jgi:hypothetical protein
MKTTLGTTLAALLLAASAARAQDGGADAATLPTCEQAGTPRVAIMAPPGKSPDEIRNAVEHGNLFPAGTQALVLQPRQYTRMRNPGPFGSRMRVMLAWLLDHGVHIDGSMSVVLRLDENGNVVEVNPNTQNAEVNRVIARTWREARFEPYVVGGCRAVAWIQVPQNFQSDWDGNGREVRVDSNPAPAP